jgi:hypothetical protein
LTYSKLTCDHPLFAWASEGEWSNVTTDMEHPCVFVFERSRWLKPTTEQIEKYQNASRIVEKLGGRMIRQEWEIAGQAPPLSPAEVQEILASMRRDFPKATLFHSWNGAGCYTLSVGVDLGEAT